MSFRFPAQESTRLYLHLTYIEHLHYLPAVCVCSSNMNTVHMRIQSPRQRHIGVHIVSSRTIPPWPDLHIHIFGLLPRGVFSIFTS